MNKNIFYFFFFLNMKLENVRLKLMNSGIIKCKYNKSNLHDNKQLDFIHF